MKLSESVVKILEHIGVSAVFAGSGQGNSMILYALSVQDKIRCIVTRNEQAASFMAYGHAYASGDIAVCCTQGGPGAVNLISGLCTALTAGVPLLSISSCTPAALRGKGDLGEATGLNGTPNGRQLFGAVTKGYFVVENPALCCDVFERAINLAYAGKPGPVHIEIPTDLMQAENPNYYGIDIKREVLQPNQADVLLMVDALSRAMSDGKRILAIVGNGCTHKGTAGELKIFLETLKMPFVFSMDAKGLMHEDSPLCVGMIGSCGDPAAKEAFKAADVLLAMGNSFNKWQSWFFASGLMDNKLLLQINNNAMDINRNHKANVAILSDAALALSALNAAMKDSTLTAKAFELTSLRLCQASIPQGDAIHPAALAAEIGRLLPENALLLGDAGSHMIWLANYAQLNRGQLYKNPGTFGPMAVHVNGSMGMQLALPQKRVVVGCGDGAYQMSGFELLTAVRENIPVVYIIFNNGQFGMIKDFNMIMYGKTAFIDVTNPSYADFARICGAKGYNITHLNDFESAFEDALASGQPAIIDVIIDSDVAVPFSNY